VDRDARNELNITGVLTARERLRCTPAGVPLLEFALRHASAQMEAGRRRRVELELAGLALGPAAQLLAAAPLGSGIRARGFLAAKSLRSSQPVMHVTDLEFCEGKDDGIQTEEAPQQA
jgi:primosomal replication protein N